MIGIYKITSPSHRVYIGQSKNIENRFKRYKGLHCKVQTLLLRSFLKYGVDNHVFEVIEECSVENLNIRERYWQEEFDVLSSGLNCILTKCDGKDYVSADFIGKKISESKKGIVPTDEHKEKISNGLKKYYSINGHPTKGISTGTKNNKLSVEQVLEIRELLIEGYKTNFIAEKYNISRSTINQIRDGKTWQSLGEFKITKRATIEPEILQQLFQMFLEEKTYQQIQQELKLCSVSISKYKKIWKKKES